MGTIVARKRKDGTQAYSAQILLKRKGKIAHRETQTFERRQAAVAWLRLREGELSVPGAIERMRAADPTLRQAIERYIAESRKDIGRTKQQVLDTIMTFAIADRPCSKISSADIVSFARELPVQPQTVGNYLSHLGAVFAVARPAWGYQLDQQAHKDAMVVARRLGIVGKSAERDRRPSIEELDVVLDHFERIRRYRPGSSPMVTIVLFALFSTRRLDETCRITWPDLDEERGRIVVRDMKHPGDKAGNDVRCNVPPEALAIIRTMPRATGDGRIFPYSTDAVGAAFTRACQFLGIEDLHLHDLRHDGVSRLFEMGGTIPEVAAVSGHRSWASLKRYTHMDQTGDKYEGWAWKARLGIVDQR